MQRVECPNCGHRLKYADEYAGRRAKCQKCGNSFRLPGRALDAEVAAALTPENAFGAARDAQPAGRPPMGRPRRKWPWLAVGGALAVLAAGAAIWFVFSGDANKRYVGPPPPVEFEIKGYKIASSVPFGGELRIRNSQIIPPAAPEGYEFTSEHQEVILGRPHSFGWKARSGSLFLVVCKVTVKDAAPRLERIRLMQGKQEVAALDGLVQSAFDKATAKDLNDGLANCHKSGKTPEVALVFRVPDGGPTVVSRLGIEVEWLGQDGKPASGRYSLKNVPLLADEKPPESPPEPTTYEGEWSGPGAGEIQVTRVVVEKNEFPCSGLVRVRFQNLEASLPVRWVRQEGQIVGTDDRPQPYRGKAPVARIRWTGGELSGDVTLPDQSLFGAGQQLTFSRFTRVGPASVREQPVEASTQATKQIATRNEMRLLQGKWVLDRSIGRNAESRYPESIAIEGDTLTHWFFGKATAGTFSIDPTERPKTIDLMMTSEDGKPFTRLGIYELDGDVLKLCAGKPGEGARPKEFDRNQGIDIYKRVKP